jgi:hypothetical protein
MLIRFLYVFRDGKKFYKRYTCDTVNRQFRSLPEVYRYLSAGTITKETRKETEEEKVKEEEPAAPIQPQNMSHLYSMSTMQLRMYFHNEAKKSPLNQTPPFLG